MYILFIKNDENTSCMVVEGMHSEVFYDVEKVEVVKIEKDSESKFIYFTEDSVSNS